MRNTEMICRNYIYRVKGGHRGYVCELTGKHLFWNQQSCPDHVETAKSYWSDHKEDKPK